MREIHDLSFDIDRFLEEAVRAKQQLVSNSLGAVVIPDVGTIYFGPYRMSGDWGTLEADKGVLVATDGRSRRLAAPVRGDGTTISGDGWTFKAAPGWVVREGTRREPAGRTSSRPSRTKRRH